jgi:hypothetical protein
MIFQRMCLPRGDVSGVQQLLLNISDYLPGDVALARCAGQDAAMMVRIGLVAPPGTHKRLSA